MPLKSPTPTILSSQQKLDSVMAHIDALDLTLQEISDLIWQIELREIRMRKESDEV